MISLIFPFSMENQKKSGLSGRAKPSEIPAVTTAAAAAATVGGFFTIRFALSLQKHKH